MQMIISLSVIIHYINYCHPNKKSSRYKVMCGCECCISEKSIHSSLLSWRDWYFKKPRIKAKILKTEGLGKKKIAYMKNIEKKLMPHGCHIYAKANDM